MDIAKSKLVIDHALTIEKNFELPHESFPFVKPLLSIKKCYGILKITKSQRLIRMDIDLSITAILECSYSLEPFAHELEIHEGMLISDSTSFDEEAISIKGDEINVEEILYALISSSLPLKPVKPGAELPKSGEGYRVLTEDELSDSNHQKSDIRFAELDKFESDID